jgi:hypothetical protein
MIKRLIICAFFLVLANHAFAQSKSDTVIIEEPPDFDTVAYNSTHLIMYFYTIQDYDSIEIVLNNWQSICGISEPIVRTRILFAILENTFSETLYDSTIVDDVLN